MAITITDLRTNFPAVAVAATASTTAAPGSSSTGFRIPGTRARTLLTYAGTVSTCTLTLWVLNQQANTWHKGATTDDLDALSPGGASPINEARDWEVGKLTVVYFQISTLTGGGTVAVHVQGVGI